MLGKMASPYNSKPDQNIIIRREIVSDLKTRFEAAVASSKTLSERPDNSTLLKLYALYKQGVDGDVEGKRPGFTDMVGRAKYDAWAGFKGTSSDEAMSQYIALIEALKAG
jgi:diazepam-binding inhibitor (GABA receptor modulating acyl-CoA-binding protein)